MLPAAFGDLPIALPVTLRFGPNAVHDALIDCVGFFTQTKGQSTFVVITNSFPLWITLFQRLTPKLVVFVSSKDPSKSLEFSFLPESLPVRLLAWPSLEEVSGQPEHDEPTQPIEPISTGEEEDAPEVSQPSGEPSLDEVEAQPTRSRAAPIQPLQNLERHQLDLRSPARQPDSEVTPKRQQQTAEQVVQVPAKFQPLIEAMKSLGKVMVSVADLEGQLKIWSTRLNQPIDNIGAYIAKAADAQIILYDKQINYVRFRNRTLASATIEYV
jgi:hypothetical protein